MHLGVEAWFDLTYSCEDFVASMETEIVLYERGSVMYMFCLITHQIQLMDF